jgi:alkylation response protein AidB-like acyl-CoA dehydrogenase
MSGVDYSQYPDTRGLDFYELDPNLQALLKRYLLPEVLERGQEVLHAMGRLVGGPVDERAQFTDREWPPKLVHYDRQGQVIDQVVYNPGYLETVRDVYGLGIVGLNYRDFAAGRRAPYLLTFALGYLVSQAEAGFYCPVTLTGACAPVIHKYASPELKAKYLPHLISMGDVPLQQGATWVTEIQGGSDVGANQTIARLEDGVWRLYGEKWFASNADADICLVTARPEGAPGGTKGLGLYVLPRRLPGGSLNNYRIKRLKDKLGTRGLPTGEVALEGAQADLLAEPPQGFKYMMEALGYSRLPVLASGPGCNAIASIGIMRRAFLEAVVYASRREAFGQPIWRYPMVQPVLAGGPGDTLVHMLVDLEATSALVFLTAAVFDQVEWEGREDRRPWLRLLTALAKYRSGEVAIPTASRAIEVLGGNGYVEEYVTARLYRDAQVLPVWEGPANIQGLEVLRVLGPKYRAHEPFFEQVDRTLDGLEDPLTCRLAVVVQRERQGLGQAMAHLASNPDDALFHARHLADYMADVLEATLLLDEADQDLQAGDGRKLVVAKLFIDRVFGSPPRRGIDSGDRTVTWFFDDLVAYRPIPRSLVERELPL